MPDPKPTPRPKATPTKKLTKELYKKNLDLFNANRTLKLLQNLYQIITSTLEVETLAQKFIEAIAADLGFTSGIVAIKPSKNNHLQIMGWTKSDINTKTIKATKLKPKKLIIPLNNKQNPLAQTVNSGKKATTTNPLDIWIPLLPEKKAPASSNLSTLAYPIKFGDKVTGVFAITSPRDMSELAESEKDILKRTATVFGIAIDRVRNYQDLQQANVQLRHLDKLKDEFVFIATHELRTPVTVINGYLDMVRDGKYGEVPPQLNEAFKELKASNDQLIQLVEDLLQIARAEAGNVTIDTQAVEICPITDKAIKGLKTLADQKKLTLEHSCPDQKITAAADPDKLTEILNNLIGNAIKYSDKGTITVSHETKDGMLVTQVADQGAGIAPNDQKKIFSRFFRAAKTAQAPGTGLGLFIVKQLAEKMGGKIWFTSELGKGTTFSFSLPLKASKTKAKADPAPLNPDEETNHEPATPIEETEETKETTEPNPANSPTSSPEPSSQPPPSQQPTSEPA